MLPESHPRYDSLRQRELLVEGYRRGATSLQGLIAFGRGEAFDYLLGEKTSDTARRAIEAASSYMLLAKKPVISLNGNTAALCPGELVRLSEALGAGLEINLFHRTEERVKVIEGILREHGAEDICGVNPDALLDGIESERRKVDSQGIYTADVVMVALEDGDRTKALIDAGKKVVAIDLNPLSRTAIQATITIVDNVVRAVPLMHEAALRLKKADKTSLKKLKESFDNSANLKESLSLFRKSCDSV